MEIELQILFNLIPFESYSMHTGKLSQSWN